MNADDASIARAANDVAAGLLAAFKARLSESGARAFRLGYARTSCPLARGSAARSYWLRGFDAAKRAGAKR